MPLYRVSTYVYFFCWIVLAFFPYIYCSNYIYEPLLLYFTLSSAYYSFIAVTNYKLPVFFRGLFVLVAVLFFYGLMLFLSGEDVYWVASAQPVRNYLYLLWLVPSLLSVVPVYVFTCRGLVSEREMKILFFIFLYSCVFAFDSSLKYQIMQAAMLNSTQEEFTVTCVYSFLSLLPLVILFRKYQVLQFILLAFMFYYFVQGAKRGPVILGAISSILLILSMYIQSTIRKKILVFFITIAFIIGIYVFVNYQIENSAYFAMRVDQTLDGYTSRRDEFTRRILDYILNETSLPQFVFGIGAQGTLSVNDSFAHNDWLAILLEQGLFGLVLYFVYWVCLFLTWIKAKCNYDAFVAIGLLIFIGLGKTLFSMYYLPVTAEMMASSGFFAIALGFYLGKAFPQQDLFLLKFFQK